MKSKPPIVRSRTNNRNGYASTRLITLAFGLLAQVARTVAAPLREQGQLHVHEDLDPEDASLWLYLGVAALLVLLGGAFAGLTIALMGQDGVYLQVIATSGEGKEQRHAEKVHNLLKKGKHWVLVTLLLSNVIVNETLPIVLDRSLGGGWPAVLGSTVLIVIFGEVIPQSICVRYGLSIGAYMAPFVIGLMWFLAPIAWPTAKLLDKLLGEDHGTVYKKAGLKTLVTLHRTLGTSPTDRLNQDEVTIISAVLDLKEKPIGDIMTPMEDVFTMSADTVLDEQTMDDILGAGYSRIPIYEPGNKLNFIGMLLVKILITYDPEDCKKVSEFALATLPETRPETSCLDIVNFFQEGKSHMVLVSDYPAENYGAIGVVTLEDVIEELIGEEIIDESDVYIDVHKAIRRMAPAPRHRVPKGHIVADPDAVVVQAPENLIDISEDRPPIVKRLTNGEDRSRSKSPPSAAFGTSPKTRFTRRSSSGADGNIVSVRGTATDMREHLKHLGPSNLASRPKTTRYNTVKIKAAQGSTRSDSRTDSNIHRDSIIEEHYEDSPASPTPRGGEGEGLLKSAGREASDGVQALQQGYGTLDRGFSYTPNKHSQPGQQKDETATSTKEVPRSSGSHSPSPPRDLSRVDSGGSSDTIASLNSHDGNFTRRKRGVARSGSITENIIEAGGVRKVVLETNSSSSDDKDDRAPSISRRGIENDPPNGDRPPMYDQNTEGPGTPKEEDVKKKRRRQRKKKGAKSSEETVLLGSGSTQ